MTFDFRKHLQHFLSATTPSPFIVRFPRGMAFGNAEMDVANWQTDELLSFHRVPNPTEYNPDQFR